MFAISLPYQSTLKVEKRHVWLLVSNRIAIHLTFPYWQVNWKTVGEEYGISSTAAQYRLYRLRDYMEGLSSPGKKALDTEMDSDDNDLGDNTKSGKATAKSKKPKATATYSDDEDEPLDDKSTLMDVKKATQEDSENDEKSTVFDSDLTGPSIKEEYEDTKEYYEVV